MEQAPHRQASGLGEAVLLLGDPKLRRPSQRVEDLQSAAFVQGKVRLQRTLTAFRQRYGFGRAIAAPQIGEPGAFIALELSAGTLRHDGPFVITNPEIVWRSEDWFTLWDDCMSFPDLLVKVRRHRSIVVRYLDDAGNPITTEQLDLATSELLQHEIDHLHGILAVDHALDRDSLVSRQVFESAPEFFASQVDYTIGGQARPAA